MPNRQKGNAPNMTNDELPKEERPTIAVERAEQAREQADEAEERADDQARQAEDAAERAELDESEQH
jgi:hypothetical protein